MKARPPEVVAAVCIIEFSLGPKYEDRKGRLFGSNLENDLTTANPIIALNMFAATPSPDFKP